MKRQASHIIQGAKKHIVSKLSQARVKKCQNKEKVCKVTKKVDSSESDGDYAFSESLYIPR